MNKMAIRKVGKSHAFSLAALMIFSLGISGCSAGDTGESPSPTPTALESGSSEASPTETVLPPEAIESIEAVKANFGDCIAALGEPGEYTYRSKSSPEGAGTVVFESESRILVWDTGLSNTGALLTMPSLATDEIFWDSGCYD